jgi:hypothetical protein
MVHASFEIHPLVKTSGNSDVKNRKNTELIHDEGSCADDGGDSIAREKNHMITRFKMESSKRSSTEEGTMGQKKGIMP